MKEVHLGEGRKYKCKFCEYHATRKANLKVHFQKMHKDLHIDAYIKAMKTNRRLKKIKAGQVSCPSMSSFIPSISSFKIFLPSFLNKYQKNYS